MGTPPRHGHDWSRVPVPANRLAGGQASSSSSVGGATKTVATAKEILPQTLPVEILHAFYQALPPFGIQHLALTFQTPYRQAEFQNGTVALMTLERSVPQGTVYVITDMKLFMTVPGSALNSPEQMLEDYALLGLLRLQVLIGERAPMKFDNTVNSPNWPAAGTALAATQTGWSILNEKFGAQRAGGFAIYARSHQSIKVLATPDDVPQFVTSRLGVHAHGFSVAEGTFDEIFRRHK